MAKLLMAQELESKIENLISKGAKGVETIININHVPVNDMRLVISLKAFWHTSYPFDTGLYGEIICEYIQPTIPKIRISTSKFLPAVLRSLQKLFLPGIKIKFSLRGNKIEFVTSLQKDYTLDDITRLLITAIKEAVGANEHDIYIYLGFYWLRTSLDDAHYPERKAFNLRIFGEER